MHQLSLQGNTFVPLFLKLIGLYCFHVVLYICFLSKFGRVFKFIKSVCMCVCEREQEVGACVCT